MPSKSPLEFYDEELSRTIRQIQQGLLDITRVNKTKQKQDDDSKTTCCSTTLLQDIDKLFTSSQVFWRQMQIATKDLTRQDEVDEWKEILAFRHDTMAVLAAQRAMIQG